MMGLGLWENGDGAANNDSFGAVSAICFHVFV